MIDMSLVSDILQELWDAELNYKGCRVNLLGIPKFKAKSKTVSSTLSRLKKKGCVELQKDGWQLTMSGKDFFKKSIKTMPNFESSFKQNAPKDMIVMFDIPESERRQRDWLRITLKNFDYVLIQQSVWVGPSPLPLDFVAYLKEEGYEKYLQTFKLSQGFRFNRPRL
jgi:DNA-binding transcriptional regulator PaaX